MKRVDYMGDECVIEITALEYSHSCQGRWEVVGIIDVLPTIEMSTGKEIDV